MLLAAAALLAGCGGQGTDRSGRDATVAIQGAPGAVHAGMYLAVQRGFDQAEGPTLTLAPTRDAAGALRSGRAQFAVLGLRRFAAVRGLVAVMAVIERPLRPRRGEPDAPGLVLAVTREELTDDPATVRGAVAAFQRGYREAFIDPDSAVSALLTAVPRLDRAKTSARLDRLGPAFQGVEPTFGLLDPTALRRWAAWSHVALDLGAFDNRYVTKG
jgi:ABC-type nitrate/sulfonate/bicarbonate transport system substrate-binding protein